MNRVWQGIALPQGVEVRQYGDRPPLIGIRFRYRGARCREWSLSASDFKTARRNIALVAAKYVEICDEIERGVFKYGNHFPDSPRCRVFGEHATRGLLFGKLADEWLDKVEGELEASTHRCYKKDIDHHLRPQFGQVPAEAISVNMIEDWLCKDLAPQKIVLKTARNILNPFRDILDWAVSRYGLPENPLCKIRLGKLWPKDQRKTDFEPEPFDEKEQAAILAKCEPVMRNMVQFWFWTGLRQQELIALKWEDVDFVHGIVKVRRVSSLGLLRNRTKTDAGMRDVRLLDPALRALHAQKPYTFLRPDGIIFVRPGSNEPRIRLDHREWRRLLKRAGVPYRPSVQCRHTFGSMMFRNSEDPQWVKKMMGHENVQTTLRYYVRFMPNDPNSPGGYRTRVDYSKAAA